MSGNGLNGSINLTEKSQILNNLQRLLGDSWQKYLEIFDKLISEIEQINYITKITLKSQMPINVVFTLVPERNVILPVSIHLLNPIYKTETENDYNNIFNSLLDSLRATDEERQKYIGLQRVCSFNVLLHLARKFIKTENGMLKSIQINHFCDYFKNIKNKRKPLKITQSNMNFSAYDGFYIEFGKEDNDSYRYQIGVEKAMSLIYKNMQKELSFSDMTHDMKTVKKAKEYEDWINEHQNVTVNIQTLEFHEKCRVIVPKKIEFDIGAEKMKFVLEVCNNYAQKASIETSGRYFAAIEMLGFLYSKELAKNAATDGTEETDPDGRIFEIANNAFEYLISLDESFYKEYIGPEIIRSYRSSDEMLASINLLNLKFTSKEHVMVHYVKHGITEKISLMLNDPKCRSKQELKMKILREIVKYCKRAQKFVKEVYKLEKQNDTTVAISSNWEQLGGSLTFRYYKQINETELDMVAVIVSNYGEVFLKTFYKETGNVQIVNGNEGKQKKSNRLENLGPHEEICLLDVEPYSKLLKLRYL